jgi:hypothetical protein
MKLASKVGLSDWLTETLETGKILITKGRKRKKVVITRWTEGQLSVSERRRKRY